MVARIEQSSNLDEIVPLLGGCGLPVSDIFSSQQPLFFGLCSASSILAVVGLELFGPVALLRSLAVSPAYRGRGLARELVVFAERTTNASDFFAKLGYVPFFRSSAPPAIQSASQFSGLCPASSAFLGKFVAGLTNSSTVSAQKTAQSAARLATQKKPPVFPELIFPGLC